MRDSTMPVKQLALTAKQKRFIASEVKAGRYRSESEVLQAGLDLLQQQKKEQTLQEMIEAGIEDADAGRVIRFTSDEDLRQHTRSLLKKVDRKLRKA